MRPSYTGYEQALKKIKHYCAYQERSHAEVREKLYSFGLKKLQVEALLSQLIEEDYLNEERFAIAFAGGKFRMKHWGKQKIKHELKQKHVSDYCIRKALNSIPQAEYDACFMALVIEKQRTLQSETNIFVKKKKIQQFLLQKGYENNLIIEALSQLK